MKLGRLSDVEMEVMQAIWGLANPVTVAELLVIFEDSKGWKTSTIATMLERIKAKGFLHKEMKGKANYYSVVATLADYQRQEGRNIISSLYGGSVKNFMTAFAEDGNMTAADVAELRDWFARSIGEDGDLK
ncbi:MAG: BlaI/MecI/CopY family transcriptional regulator [Defluviitaleaceae bacterium]|nr:BlaI/MecI/CopY family transcriptional regulator [Defluviitaleaceae bacterium]